jgi:hypothetical protein
MFSEAKKLVALAIVHIFETSKPLGDYSAVAVLTDGAGISYGINQFTHRSGSLYQVVTTYLGHKPTFGVDVLSRELPILRMTTPDAIRQLAKNAAFRNALSLAGTTPEMQAAQRQVANDRYVQPAIDACEGSNFTLPLSLAAVYDSFNQGGFPIVRDRVAIGRGEHPNAEDFEQAWISDYCRERRKWLLESKKAIVRGTTYRPDFFIEQIGRGNWNLDLPVTVHGYKLTDAMVNIKASAATPAVEPATKSDNSVAMPVVTGEVEPAENPQKAASIGSLPRRLN